MDLLDVAMILGGLTTIGAAVFLGYRLFVAPRLETRRTAKPSVGAQLQEAVRVLFDVRRRTVDTFVQGGLRGAQLRHELYGKGTRISYGVRRLASGVEHKLSLAFEGAVGGDPQKDLAELVRLILFLTLVAKLEPVEPVEVETSKRQAAVIRVLTETQTMELRRGVAVPDEPSLLSTFDAAAAKVKHVVQRATQAS